MFRCITELKGLLIDIDNFENDINQWDHIVGNYNCAFLTACANTAKTIKNRHGEKAVYVIDAFIKPFIPSQVSHKNILEKMGLESTEMAYVSTDKSFLDNAMRFLGGTIWITKDELSYGDMSVAPDLICNNASSLAQVLDFGIEGFLGEVSIYPTEDIKKGLILPLTLELEEELLEIYLLGRYFGYSHYMNQLHPFSSAIYLNKQEGKTYYGKYNDSFSRLYTRVIKRIIQCNRINIDGVCAVPARPGKSDRYKAILEFIAEECKIENYSKYFFCNRNFPTQKGLTSDERHENVKDVFSYSQSLRGKKIILIDDVITTGATVKSCAKELIKKGAEQVHVVILAINQMQKNYWSSNEPKVNCPSCGEKMHLLINGIDGSFFYSCYSCGNTLDFVKGRALMVDWVNATVKEI